MRHLPFLACGAFLAAAAVVSLGVGEEWIPPARVVGALLPGGDAAAGPSGRVQELDRVIVRRHRLPLTAFIALVGAALGASGAAYQGILRNPLADPYLTGVAPGAALGAVLAMAWSGSGGSLGLAHVPAGAFVGALATVLAVYRVARVGGSTHPSSLILAGVAVGSFVSAATYLVLLGTRSEMRRAIYFMLGGFRPEGWSPTLICLPYIAAGAIVLVLLARRLNVLQFGDEQALQLGLDVERSRLVLTIAASLVAAAAVAFAGIIGFVGLVVPHTVRILWGPDHRRLVPLSLLGGGGVLLIADAGSRAIPALSAVPLGIVTALLGAPFFIWLLRRGRAAFEGA
jgi:iron complex transport system permease protein